MMEACLKEHTTQELLFCKTSEYIACLGDILVFCAIIWRYMLIIYNQGIEEVDEPPYLCYKHCGKGL